MRQKELRIALVCYGGVSLAIYMHGITKEVWKLARASRSFHAHETPADGVEQVYTALMQHIEQEHDLRLRILPDILTGASAGGINAVFLAQAIHSGQSLEPLTKLWLENADVERLVDPEAAPWSRMAKLWAMPLVWWFLRLPGNAINASVAPETRDEVRRKVSGLIRSRWFKPPFSGRAFSRMILNALDAMAKGDIGAPLLPLGHPLDLAVTVTDFRGHKEQLRLHSPPVIDEREHRMEITFHATTPFASGADLAHPCELVLAARATASFPGAFPPLRVAEIDALQDEPQCPRPWADRAQFLQRTMPSHFRQGTVDNVALIDGSVLNNAPFARAISRLAARPAQREVDRRIVYIDPRPDDEGVGQAIGRPVGFFATIFGSLSTIPREQPIRDNLELLERQSFEAERLRRMVDLLQPEVDAAVEKLFGMTLFLDRPTPARLGAWRAKAQQVAAEKAGYTYHSYAQAKMAGIVERLARLIVKAGPFDDEHYVERVIRRLRNELDSEGLASLAARSGGASAEAVSFLRAHDITFRIRRLRLLARRLSRDWAGGTNSSDEAMEQARQAIFRALSLYEQRESEQNFGPDFQQIAAQVLENPRFVLERLAATRLLPETDAQAEAILSEALEKMDKPLRRRVLFAYLGFPFYDIATLPLLRNEGLTEFDPVKVDRISPEDALTLRTGGTAATLRGIEFFNFGGFFSRAYRENDYLWGRLNGAERMIDLISSTAPEPLAPEDARGYKRAAFLSICDEELARGLCATALVESVKAEILDRLGPLKATS